MGRALIPFCLPVSILVLRLVGLAQGGTVYHAYPDPSCQEMALSDQGEACQKGGQGFVKCVGLLKEPGDECRLHSGRYPFRGEPLQVRGLHGTSDSPFVIAAAEGEESGVVLDGTIPVTASAEDWKPMKPNSNIYEARAQADIWQLFVDGEMEVNARWPNAFWSDLSVFNVSHWAHSSNNSNSTAGVMVDDGSHGVAFDGIDITGAVAILNTGSWDTYPCIVQTHEPGSDSFRYNATGQYHDNAWLNRYFLEGKLEFLDHPTEWFYDKATGLVYVMMADDQGPSGHNVVGKVSSYALNITDCSYLVLANMTFFSTTIWASSMIEHGHANSSYVHVQDGKAITTYIDNISILSVNFSYPSYSRRMLKDTGLPVWTLISSLPFNPRQPDIMVGEPPAMVARNQDTEWPLLGDDTGHGHHVIFNSSWMFTDGPALNFQGESCQVVNNYFAYNDWSGADNIMANGGRGTVNSHRGHADYFAHNTLYRNGASTGYQPAPGSTVKLNRIIGQCWGDIQHDGAGIQVMATCQLHTSVSQNWVHDSVKYGIRFDGQPPRVGQNGTMAENVAWNCGDLVAKGDFHQVAHNMAFDLHKETESLRTGQNCSICVYGYVRANPVPINNHTVTSYNAADYINGGTGNGGHSKVRKVEPIAGHPYGNIQADIRDEVLDADNYDFRPRKNSTFSKFGKEMVGPYWHMDTQPSVYWIPGRVMDRASTPIPPDGSATVKADRDSVMWQPGYQSRSSQVTFLEQCPPNETTMQRHLWSSGIIDEKQNVYRLPTQLKPGTKYCWRVDTTDQRGHVLVGDVWGFTTLGK